MVDLSRVYVTSTLVLYYLLTSYALALKYEAPSFCTWSAEHPEASRVAVACQVRALEHADNRTLSLAGLQVEGTTKLRVECDPSVSLASTLVPSVFQRLIQLEELEIEDCKFTVLQQEAFHGLRDLKKLSVRTGIKNWSPVRQLELSPFDGLKELQSLNLSYNNLREVPMSLFCQLSNLNTLNLSHNALEQIDPALLGAVTEETPNPATSPCEMDVLTLDLSYNNLSDLPSAVSSPKRRRLQRLLVQDNQLTALRASSLTGLTALRVINASSNRLENLPLVPLRETCRELRELHLRKNQLHELRDVIQRLEQLLVLDVAKNQLVSLGSSFEGLIRLIVLDLGGNALTRLESADFKDLYSLQILDLKDNAIANIASDAFLPVYNLHTLNLAGNRLTHIGPSTLNGLFVLSKLTLSLNLITDIDPRGFRNCSDLKELDLSGNVLTEVPIALTELPFLRTLDLGENRIVGFRNGSFRNLHQLTGLRLIDNNIGNVTADMMWDLVGIQVLNLAKNKIQSVERGAFQRNEKLEAIRLDANYLTDVNGVFTALPSLVWLNLSDNHLVWFDFAFVPSSLQWLDIHSNFVEKLGNYYEIIEGFHLRTIDVGHNRLTELTPLSIPNSAEIFLANNNRIKKVATGTFKEKLNLTRVDLYANDLEFLDLMALRVSNKNLLLDNFTRPAPEFYLGGNPFKCDCTMEWLQRASVANLSDLSIYPKVMDLDDVICRPSHARESTDRIPAVIAARSSSFLCKYQTHCFSLCHCCDFDSCECEMLCPQNCTCYHDQSWTVNMVDCSSSNHVVMPANIPMDATEVYLDGNNIRELQNHAFVGRKNLVILYVNNSKVEAIENNTFSGLNSLESLYLHDNNMRILHGHEFENLFYLRELFLQNNKLIQISNVTFASLRSLQTLRLDNNRLVSFPAHQLSLNPYLSEIYLANNPWACRCKFALDLRHWLHQEAGRSIPDSGLKKCLNKHRATTICEFEEEEEVELEAQRLLLPDYLPAVLIVILALILVLILAILAVIYRDSVRLWIFARYGIRLFNTTSSAGSGVSSMVAKEEKDKLYDAYVCYSPRDEDNVVQYLSLGLESGYPRYSLCLHYRDLASGARDAAVVHAGEASRRVVLVVTRNFLQTEWPRREFRAALKETLQGRMFKLIIIEESGGLPPEVERDPDLRPFLKGSKRIRWGDKKFWERLKYLMPESRQYRQNINFTIDANGAGQTHGTFPGKRKVENATAAAALSGHPLFHLQRLHEQNNPNEPVYASVNDDYGTWGQGSVTSGPITWHQLQQAALQHQQQQLHQQDMVTWQQLQQAALHQHNSESSRAGGGARAAVQVAEPGGGHAYLV